VIPLADSSISLISTMPMVSTICKKSTFNHRGILPCMLTIQASFSRFIRGELVQYRLWLGWRIYSTECGYIGRYTVESAVMLGIHS